MKILIKMRTNLLVMQACCVYFEIANLQRPIKFFRISLFLKDPMLIPQQSNLYSNQHTSEFERI